MFGGDSTKVFLDPSAAQLKMTQIENTRAMMRLRQNPSAAILAHEWSSFASDNILDGQITGRYIDLLSIEARKYDERIGRLAAQHLAPLVRRLVARLTRDEPDKAGRLHRQ